MSAIAFEGPRPAVRWFLAYLGLLLLSRAADPWLAARAADVPGTVRVGLFVGNIVGVSVATYLVLQYFVRQRERAMDALAREHRRSERLLLNVLPGAIALRLKEGPDGFIADRFPQATVLFADVVRFTPFAEQVEPEFLVEVLDRMFTAFDRLAEERRLEKIKTIGDAYLVAGGLPEERPDHAEAVADLAPAMREESGRHQLAGRPLACGSASTAVPWWPGSSGGRGSSTTCGATP
jgi:uncharacterized membrane protein (DUF485 family)